MAEKEDNVTYNKVFDTFLNISLHAATPNETEVQTY